MGAQGKTAHSGNASWRILPTDEGYQGVSQLDFRKHDFVNFQAAYPIRPTM